LLPNDFLCIRKFLSFGKIACEIFFLFFSYTVFASPLQAAEEPVGLANFNSPQEALIGEQNIATLGGEPSAIVDGCVNVITGTFIDQCH
jgi:hypothetical protein